MSSKSAAINRIASLSESGCKALRSNKRSWSGSCSFSPKLLAVYAIEYQTATRGGWLARRVRAVCPACVYQQGISIESRGLRFADWEGVLGGGLLARGKEKLMSDQARLLVV